MLRKLCVVCIVLGCLLISGRGAWAQEPSERSFGGGLGYDFELNEDFLLITGMGWMPVEGPNIVFKPMVFSPRISKYLGFGHWQIDGDMLWDIPLAAQTNLRPYMGMGVGIAFESFGEGDNDVTPLLNFVMGLRYKKPEWKYQIALETHYSSGINYANTMHINLTVLFPFGRR